MTIEYIKGTDNKVADCLSWVTEWLDADSIRQLIQHTKAGGMAPRAETDDPWMAQEDERINNEIIVQARAYTRRAAYKNVANKHWVKAQIEDPVIKHVCNWMGLLSESRISLSDFLVAKVTDANRLAYSCWQKDLVMSHNLLYMEHNVPGTDERMLAFVVPAKRCQSAIDRCHCDASHQGRDRMLSLMWERFWWPGMPVQVVMTVKGCLRCKQFEAKLAIADLVMLESMEPLDLLHINIVNMETTLATNKKLVVKKVLVAVDHFTRYVRAFVVPNHKAETIAQILYDNYFSVFSFPRQLMSNKAPEFIGGIMTVLCDILHVKKLRTLAYHPQSNSAVERTHQPLMRMIGKLDANWKHRWPDHISSICHAYNMTKSQVMGYSLCSGEGPTFPLIYCSPWCTEWPWRVLASMSQCSMSTSEHLLVKRKPWQKKRPGGLREFMTNKLELLRSTPWQGAGTFG